jgi:hypothetical protein
MARKVFTVLMGFLMTVPGCEINTDWWTHDLLPAQESSAGARHRSCEKWGRQLWRMGRCGGLSQVTRDLGRINSAKPEALPVQNVFASRSNLHPMRGHIQQVRVADGGRWRLTPHVRFQQPLF